MTEECRTCAKTAKRCSRIEVLAFVAVIVIGVLYIPISMLAPHYTSLPGYLAVFALGVSIGAAYCAV